MNRQERARVIASLTTEEIRQLRDRASDAATSDANGDAELRFARNLFRGGSDDDDQDVDEDDDDEGDDDEHAAQKRFVAALFADTDQDPIIAGLVAGRTVGRTTPPRRDDTPRENFNFS
jgi:hypothetical protein